MNTPNLDIMSDPKTPLDLVIFGIPYGPQYLEQPCADIPAVLEVVNEYYQEQGPGFNYRATHRDTADTVIDGTIRPHPNAIEWENGGREAFLAKHAPDAQGGKVKAKRKKGRVAVTHA